MKAVTRDQDRNPTQIITANGAITDRTFDSLGNLLTRTEAVGDPLERVTSFEYEPVFNRVTKFIDPALNETTIAYDANGNLATAVDGEIDEIRLARDAAGNVTEIVEGFGTPEQRTSTLTYDARDRDPLPSPTRQSCRGAA